MAHDPAAPERFLAVPGDPNPLKGSADVALSDGSLRLRSRFGVWIDARLLEPDLRVGDVAAVDVERTRQRWLEVGDGKTTGTVLAQEVDDDPEYQDWCEDVLGPARQRLVEARETKEDDVADESKGVVVPFRRSPRFMASRAAASVALVVTGGLALLLWRSNERVQSLESTNRIVEEHHREELRGCVPGTSSIRGHDLRIHLRIRIRRAWKSFRLSTGCGFSLSRHKEGRSSSPGNATGKPWSSRSGQASGRLRCGQECQKEC